VNQFPLLVRRRLEAEPLAISPFVGLELDYLHEVGKFSSPSDAVIDDLRLTLELTELDLSAGAVCRMAAGLTWTRDPFDRLLSAHALVVKLPLVTRDETIRAHLPLAWWGE
jgi:PIN domain nuclease of toxin-antitoxin system